MEGRPRLPAAVADPTIAAEIAPLLKDENESVRQEAERLLKKWKAEPEGR